ncbi:terminase small subunit [Parendozoicomonas haliclonae]|uniref:Terminase small subunit n=1 Tax=Parendozoicomonas haliclonae TaxID=1960125 RepID=A0A1X7AF07_9GAMM|nr:terminase small subunit [Parendozoicomonas haliclonae]SMA36348.1 Terminase small subunit [Parendozoicomonas haliclonae]
MNSRHQRFVNEYLLDQNATRAAIAAGYSEKTARSQGSRLLTNVDISQTITDQQAQINTELLITAQAKRERLWAIATFNSQTYVDQSGDVRMRDPRAATSAIAELNKMDGSYVQAGHESTYVTFIQDFGDGGEDDRLGTVFE